MIASEWRPAIRAAASAESWAVAFDENQCTGNVAHDRPGGVADAAICTSAVARVTTQRMLGLLHLWD